MPTAALIVAILGCDPNARASYGYAQPTYGYQQQYGGYQQQAYQQPAAYIQADSGAYAAAVAAQVKKDLAAQAALKAQQDLAAQVSQLAQIVTKLADQPQPQPQPQPFQAALPSPQSPALPVPEKSVPFSAPPTPSPQYPTVPTKQPAFGLSQPIPSQPYGVPEPPVAQPAGAEGFLPRMGLSYGSGTPGGMTSLADGLTRCAECHTGADSKRGVKIWEAPGQLADLSLDEKRLLFDAVVHRRMPPRSATVYRPASSALAASINAELGTIASAVNEAGR